MIFYLTVKSDKEKAVALLHDILEDTVYTVEDLLPTDLDNDVIEAVVILTKKDEQSYDEYLELVSENLLARKVKIADMLSNLADNPTKNQIIRYAKGLLFLIDIEDTPALIDLHEVDRYKDGGTIILIDAQGKEYFLDRRIGTFYKDYLFDYYPGERNATTLDKSLYNIILK